MKNRNSLLIALFIVAGILLDTRPAAAQYPTKPIEAQVVFPAGGPSDTEMRIVTKHAEKVLGQRIIIINVSGAGGVVGFNNVPKGASDGYWLTGYNLPHIFAQPLVVKEARFTKDDFIPLIHWSRDPGVFAVSLNSPYKTLKDLVADAKANPDKVTVGISGRFLGHHLALLQLEDAAGIQLKEVAFRGSAESIPAMLGDHTKALSDNLSDMLRIKEKVRILAVASSQRHPLAPDVPTFAEQGFPQVVMSSDRGIAAPKGTPDNIVRILRDAFWQAIQTKEFTEDANRAAVALQVMRGDEIAQYWAEAEIRVKELLTRLKLVR